MTPLSFFFDFITVCPSPINWFWSPSPGFYVGWSPHKHVNHDNWDQQQKCLTCNKFTSLLKIDQFQQLSISQCHVGENEVITEISAISCTVWRLRVWKFNIASDLSLNCVVLSDKVNSSWWALCALTFNHFNKLILSSPFLYVTSCH